MAIMGRFGGLLAGAALAVTLGFAAATFAPTAANAAACSPAAAPLDTTDVTLSIGATNYAASNCAIIGSGNPTEETANFNTVFGPGFVFLAKFDDEGLEQGTFGINFTITADLDQVTGDFTITWSEAAGEPNIPALMDLGFILKSGAPDAAAYLFEEVLITVDPTTGEGTFTMKLLNRGGNVSELSHITMVGRGESIDIPVPEPATLGLLGLGLLGLGYAVRRRRVS
ncbi:MAG: PEP-CTERM sorting domain-containing protein [Alphaproteobacteria bacterium]|nr:PEP-CTERM sorting domain-containing protein [Alphaproteobacteria bacterium]